jgi:delta(3,5)-delta(2,4)-dienoyl-CoA isomerase
MPFVANMSQKYSPKHFLVDFPAEYIVHIQTNRPAKLNAYYEPYAPSSS